MKTKLNRELYHLGTLDAWTKEERQNLSRNFLPIKQFSEIADPDNIFLCGRRGTGKSAIALMLEKEGSQNYKVAVPGERENYGRYTEIVEKIHMMRTTGVRIDVPFAVRRLWLWAIQVKAMQVILSASCGSPLLASDDLQQITAYFATLPKPLDAASDMGTMLTITFQRAANLLGTQGEEAYERYLTELVGVPEFHRALDAIGRHLRDKTLLIVLDTLESYKIFQEYMIAAFQGILDAMLVLWSDSRLDHIYLKLFLPAEVFDRLAVKYPGKVLSRAVFLRWRSADLISMISRRFLGILARCSSVTADQQTKLESLVDNAYEQNDGRRLRGNFWYDSGFLPRQITNALGDKEDCFAYIFRHSLRRPRDVIVQMQTVIYEALEREEFPRISEAAVVAGVHRPRLLAQIVGESLTPYERAIPAPLLKAARDLFFHKPAIMSWREIRNFAQGIYSVAPVANVNPEDFLEVLGNCGLIGLVDERQFRGKGSPLYTKARFEYIMQGVLPFHTGLQYAVHPALCDLLEMELPPGAKAIYPFPETLEDSWLEHEIGVI